jgi:hypothetical protein
MKKLWAAIVVIVIVAGAFFLLHSKNSPPGNPPADNSQISASGPDPRAVSASPQSPPATPPGATAPTATAPNDLSARVASPSPGASSPPDTNGSPNLPPLTVLDKARVVIHNYHAAFGENPVGNNAEITAALMGKNPKQVNFVAESELHLNEKGELIDGYGTPFFFHQISGHEMEIRSAGPDHIMWTSDDLVTR